MNLKKCSSITQIAKSVWKSLPGDFPHGILIPLKLLVTQIMLIMIVTWMKVKMKEVPINACMIMNVQDIGHVRLMAGALEKNSVMKMKRTTQIILMTIRATTITHTLITTTLTTATTMTMATLLVISSPRTVFAKKIHQEVSWLSCPPFLIGSLVFSEVWYDHIHLN